MDPVIVFVSIIIISIVLSIVIVKVQYETSKNSWMSDPIKNRDHIPEELRDSYPLDPGSSQYENSLKELIEYNKRMVHCGNLFLYIFLVPPGVLTFFLLFFGQLFHGNAKVLFRTGILGTLWPAFPIIIGFYGLVIMCIYEHFDFPNLDRHRYFYPQKDILDKLHVPWPSRYYYFDPLDTHDIKVFPDAIKPYLSQGAKAAWYFVRHRNDSRRKFYRILALILIPITIYFTHQYFANTFKDLSNPPQSIQMQTEYSRLIYSKHYRMYVMSCNDISGKGYDFYLSKREVEKIIDPLLPYFQYDGKTVNNWSEADIVLKDGKKLFLKNNPAKAGTTIFISMYPKTKSLCGFVLGKRDK